MVTLEVFPITVTDDFGQETLGCSLKINDDTATVADFLEALDIFAANYLAECWGCDGCCRERAPLIAADIPSLAALLPPSKYPAHAVCAAFAEIYVDKDGFVDICFRRDATNACILLDQNNKCCSQHNSRAFVCRSHFCIPRSEVFEEFREEVVNGGENELIRLLLAEEANEAPPLGTKKLTSLLSPEDFPSNPQSNKQSYEQLIIKDCINKTLFEQIKEEGL